MVSSAARLRRLEPQRRSRMPDRVQVQLPLPQKRHSLPLLHLRQLGATLVFDRPDIRRPSRSLGLLPGEMRPRSVQRRRVVRQRRRRLQMLEEYFQE